MLTEFMTRKDSDFSSRYQGDELQQALLEAEASGAAGCDGVAAGVCAGGAGVWCEGTQEHLHKTGDANHVMKLALQVDHGGRPGNERT